MNKELKVVVIGAGSSYTPELVEGLLLREGSLPIRELWLVDIEAGRWKAEIIYQLALRMVERAGHSMKVILTDDRETALKDADFVCFQFRAGGIESRVQDEAIAAKFGMIAQETNGIVGLANALRTIPIALDIARQMEQLCPEAWLLNFTNPSGLVTEAILQQTSIKALGLCNVPVIMEHSVLKMLDTTANELFFQVAGLNHLIWARKIQYKGQDKMPYILERAITDNHLMLPKNIEAFDWSPILLRQLEMLPCAYLRYFYASWDTKPKQTHDQNKPNRADVVKEIETKLFDIYKDPNLDVKPKELELRGGQYYSESACRLMNAVFNDTGEIMHVNTINDGAINGLPTDCVVEVSSVIRASGAHPLRVEAFPQDTLRLIQTMKTVEQLTIEAAINGSVGLALRALTLNPIIESGSSLELALKEILEQNLDATPAFKRDDINRLGEVKE